MHRIQPLQGFDRIKQLSDERRLMILRLLMAGPATLSQLARNLRQSPAWVRHHMLTLESAGLVELAEIRKIGRITEKYYRARAGAFLLQEMILPKSKNPAILFSGSDDPALEGIAGRLAKHVTLFSLPVGSLDGLVNLRQGLCQLSGSHLLDESGEYNLPFIRHIFPDREVAVITLAYRTQGWMLAPGNPKHLKGMEDLGRKDVLFVNRNRGSGTRVWIDAHLKKMNIPVGRITGYDNEVMTHNAAAKLIQAGNADMALGLQAAAGAHGLEFIPVFEERYDLVLLREHEPEILPILDHIQTREFRDFLTSLSGYNAVHTGEQIRI